MGGQTANTWETAYWIMLQLRRAQEGGNQLGHIGFFPIQSFKFFWSARSLALWHDGGGEAMTTCEVGFGSGMSTALVVRPRSSLRARTTSPPLSS